MSNLSILAVILGLGVAASGVYGLVNPKRCATLARNFPRHPTLGIALMLAATVWFVYNVSQESIADFASYKKVLLLAFAAIGIGACVFVRDFLPVRGLAVLLLLLAKLMVDTGRPYLDKTSWVLVIQLWAYAMVFVGMWLTISPWRLRDWINWSTVDQKRLKLAAGLRLSFGLLVAIVGLVKFQ